MSTLEKDFDYKEEHFDFIQQSIRKFCLQYGAALFYTSVKEDKNCDLLYKYLVHKIYNFPFRTPALVVEKDAVFMWVSVCLSVCVCVCGSWWRLWDIFLNAQLSHHYFQRPQGT